jgi:hypothetical protein
MTSPRMERRIQSQRSIVRARAALCSIQTWMETTVNVTEDQSDYLESLAQIITDGAKWLDKGAVVEAVLPVWPKSKPEIPEFLRLRDERRAAARAIATQASADQGWHGKAMVVPQEQPDTVRGVAI